MNKKKQTNTHAHSQTYADDKKITRNSLRKMKVANAWLSNSHMTNTSLFSCLLAPIYVGFVRDSSSEWEEDALVGPLLKHSTKLNKFWGVFRDRDR